MHGEGGWGKGLEAYVETNMEDMITQESSFLHLN